MPNKDNELTKAAAAYEAMLTEVLRNSANGITPGLLVVSDHLAAEQLHTGPADAANEAPTA